MGDWMYHIYVSPSGFVCLSFLTDARTHVAAWQSVAIMHPAVCLNRLRIPWCMQHGRCGNGCGTQAIICVEFGVETLLDHYLGDSPVGSVGCMVVGAGIMLGIRFRNLNVASGLLQAFYSKQIL